MKSREDESYRIGAITDSERLSIKVIDFVHQETCTPARCAPDLEHTDPKKWQEAWENWEGWMESHWRDLAITHACEPLTDKEVRQQYGRWKDREKQEGKGKDLLWIVNSMQRPGKGWMH